MVIEEESVECESVKQDEAEAERQNARAKLRESFLNAITELQGEPCKILTYEKSSLDANFAVLTPCGSEILVRDLETPACVKMKTALLRVPDILAVQFERPVLLP